MNGITVRVPILLFLLATAACGQANVSKLLEQGLKGAVATLAPIPDSEKHDVLTATATLLAKHVTFRPDGTASSTYHEKSQWPIEWRRAQAGSYTLSYAKRLHEFGEKLNAVTDRTIALTAIKQYFTDELSDDLLADANGYVDGLGANRRSGVRTYHVALWLWHRLDADRWKNSKVPLRDRPRKTPKLEVDHVVAVHKWETLKAADPSFSGDDSRLHSIGNCLLLEKSFNISKGKRTMAEFLGDIVSLGAQGAKELLDSLLISEGHSSLQSQTLATLQVIVEERESIIKRELKEFIEGVRVRQDS